MSQFDQTRIRVLPGSRPTVKRRERDIVVCDAIAFRTKVGHDVLNDRRCR